MSDNITLNVEQIGAITQLSRFLKSVDEKIIVLEGSAGTGKSTLISKVFQDPVYSKMKICMSATTNKAVSVLKQMGSVKNKKIDYLTIHKLMKIKRTIDSDGKQHFVTSFNETTDSREKKCKSIFDYNVIVIDEASMVNKQLFKDITEISKKIMGKIIFVGDRNQLPPVNQNISEVFTKDYYNIITLTEIMRSRNNIVNISNYIRDSINDTNSLKLRKFRDANVIIHRKEDEWLKTYLEKLQIRDEKAIILAYTNNRCSVINNLIRNMLFTPEQTKQKYVKGEHIVFNNYYKNQDYKYYTSQTAVIREVSLDRLNVEPIDLSQLINLKNKLLPETKVLQEKKHEPLKIEERCPICLVDEIDDGVVTVCKHKFCLECLKQWIDNNKCCPLCRVDISDSKFLIKDNTPLTILINKLAELINNLSFDVYNIKLSDGNTIYTLTEESKKKYTEVETKLKDMMVLIKTEVFRSKRMIKFGLVVLSRLWLYIFNNVIDIFAEINYGYCITSHKSQGSTYDNVFVDVSNILKCNHLAIDGMKCLYTSVTRASENLHLFY